MNKIVTLLIVLTIVATCDRGSAQTSSENGVEFELIVRQKPAAVDKFFEITRDTVEVIVGKSLHTFLVNMSLDIHIESIDTLFVTFTSHLTTVGRAPYNFAERYRIEMNLPARVENIPGKDGSFYQLLISPRRLVSVDTTVCTYDPYAEGQFRFDPTANFDLHYVQGSLGDFQWNNVKNYLEADFALFKNAFNITAPGKISFYLCPCPVMTVRWDKRFGYSIDPARFNIFAIHTHEFTSVDALLPNMLWLLRLRGYAPPFLVEGLAGYFDFVPYKIKKLKDKGSIPRISDLATTAGYFRADPVEAEITAAAFVKYLADSYGLTKILDLYDRSDDLTLLKNIESIYEKPLDSLETEWANYIDTISLSRMLFDRYAGRANALFQSNLQIEYLQQMTEYDKTNYDSVDTWQKLSMVYYQYGQYYDAIDGYKLLAAIDPAKPLYQQVLGNLYLITGSYDSAWSAFDAAAALDTTFATARLLQARILTIRGDTAAAIELAEEAYGSEQTMAGKIEFLLFLGEMYQTG
ncbi:MAG: hypothetical protein JSU69_07295, partial [Candidatus Zixiibacteriota bacterium]